MDEKTNTYRIGADEIDSLVLKCLLTSKGMCADPEVYEVFGPTSRISTNPMELGSLILSDGLACSFTDVGPFLDAMGGRYQWSTEEKRTYNPQLQTPFNVRVIDGRAALLYHDDVLDWITFPPAVDFYERKTTAGTPFAGTISLRGTDFATFAYLWPCEYAHAGRPCEYCHSGIQTARAAERGEQLGGCFPVKESAEMLKWGVEHAGVRSLMATGGSTFDGVSEGRYYIDYLEAWNEALGGHLPGHMVLYLTPPRDKGLLDRYIELGADKMGISIEVWDGVLAQTITPGKIEFTTRERHLDAWDYVVERHGPNYVFTNFILGIEPFESLERGVRAVAERGVFPGGSVWVPMGALVGGRLVPPGIDFYKRCVELWLDVYDRYDFEPACSMANGDIEPDVYRLLHYGSFTDR